MSSFKGMIRVANFESENLEYQWSYCEKENIIYRGQEGGRRAEISAEQQSEFPSSVVYRPYVTKDKMGGWL